MQSIGMPLAHWIIGNFYAKIKDPNSKDKKVISPFRN